jgi:hypothetical protein
MARLLMVGCMLVMIACGSGVPEVPPGTPVSYSRHVEPLIVKRCVGCHTAEEQNAELVLEQGRGYAEMVGRSSAQVPEIELVVPDDSAASYLWMKLDHTAAKGKGMPRILTGSKRLPGRELELIRRWIEDGAQP